MGLTISPKQLYETSLLKSIHNSKNTKLIGIVKSIRSYPEVLLIEMESGNYYKMQNFYFMPIYFNGKTLPIKEVFTHYNTLKYVTYLSVKKEFSYIHVRKTLPNGKQDDRLILQGYSTSQEVLETDLLEILLQNET